MNMSEGNCSFYLFKPSGKWKYEGRGNFPNPDQCEDQFRVSGVDICRANGGTFPGTVCTEKTIGYYNIVAIPDEDTDQSNCWPRLIFATDKE